MRAGPVEARKGRRMSCSFCEPASPEAVTAVLSAEPPRKPPPRASFSKVSFCIPSDYKAVQLVVETWNV